MQQLMARHLLFGLDPRKVATFCQQRAFELRVWAAQTTPDSAPEDKWQRALSLSRMDLRGEDVGVSSDSVRAFPCRDESEAASEGHKIESRMAELPHIPALLSFAEQHGAVGVLQKLEEVAESGHPGACYLLYQHEAGISGPGDPGALRWLRAAVDGGHADAQMALAVLYEEGDGVEQSWAEAARHYKMAADQGIPIAQFNLAVCYENGNGVDQSWTEAVRHYMLAADGGDLVARFNLGWCYENGEGVERDMEEAVRYYRLAADQGDAKAQRKLVECYMRGEGVERSWAETARYCRLAADQGDIVSQFRLALCYQIGEGVEQSWEEAARHYKMAADRGHAEAQFNLALR
jgi:TPR repeat protein